MPEATKPLINALRRSIVRLQAGERYEWGHVGRCNCGHLAQSICGLDDRKILSHFGEHLGEWTELAKDYCDVSGLEVEQLVESLAGVGFGLDDIRHLEFLDDDRVLKHLPDERRHLQRNERADVILYMETLANLLEDEMKRAA
ncbi:MAG: hypothetical protein AAF514_13295 [Verrucomicrobiota bacterium]